MKTGVVKEYDPIKGFGFVSGDDGEDYFLHLSGLREYLKQRGVRSGQRVAFDVDYSHQGDKAVNVKTV